jgi:DNA-binding response OmpR family regulator
MKIMASADPSMASSKPDQRYKFGKLQVLVADSDSRAAHLVKEILMSFGMRRIDTVTTGEDAMRILKSRRIDLLVTEWSLDGAEGIDGLTLVRAVRAAKNQAFLKSDMPILMLTGRAARPHVEAARDVGITEFVAKPFSAKTISTRVIEIIDSPREFVETPTYKGPSRRRKTGPPPGMQDRRLPRDVRERMADAAKVTITRANFALRELVDGASASEIITNDVIAEAQTEIAKSEDSFVAWIKDDIATLENAYEALLAAPTDKKCRKALINGCYTIKSQSGVFGYDLGTVVADLMVSYLEEHTVLSENNFIVIRKHIDTMGVIFTQKIKEADGAVGLALIGSLSKLVAKFA